MISVLVTGRIKKLIKNKRQRFVLFDGKMGEITAHTGLMFYSVHFVCNANKSQPNSRQSP
jgi:hypothetical protein